MRRRSRVERRRGRKGCDAHIQRCDEELQRDGETGAAICKFYDDAVIAIVVVVGRHGIVGVTVRAPPDVRPRVEPRVSFRPDGEDAQRQHQCDAEHRGEAVQTGAG